MSSQNFIINNINDRKYDLAVLRTLGFTKNKIFSLILIEGMTISFLGSLIGLVIGSIIYASIEYLSMIGRNMISLQFDFVFNLFAVWLIVMVASFLTCLIPCIKVYKQNIRWWRCFNCRCCCWWRSLGYYYFLFLQVMHLMHPYVGHL